MIPGGSRSAEIARDQDLSDQCVSLGFGEFREFFGVVCQTE